MKKKIISIFSIVMAVMLSVFFSGIITSTNKTINAAESTQQSFDCYYLIGEHSIPYRIDTTKHPNIGPAGTATGYTTGEVLGTENLTITATANPGYKLVGWKIEYVERLENSQAVGAHEYIDLTTFSANSQVYHEQVGASSVSYEVRKQYTNLDKICNAGSFKISKVAENLNITPVFDFVYYKLDVSSIFKLRARSGDNIYRTTDNKIYYTSATSNCYKDAVLNDDGNYYYLGDVYDQSGILCTKHEVLQGDNQYQYIPVETNDRLNGSFRMGETINFGVNFNVIGEYNDFSGYKASGGVNIDFVGVSVASKGEEIKLSNSNVTVTKQKDGSNNGVRSTGVNVQLDLGQEGIADMAVVSDNQTLALSAEYHNLYLVEFSAKVDGVAINMATEADPIKRAVLDTLLVDYSYYKFNNYNYLAKNAKDNLGRAFTVAYQNVISARDANNIIYNYYSFASISRSEYSNLATNAEVLIEYVSYRYKISFVPMVENDGLYPLNNMTVHEDVECVRGETVPLIDEYYMLEDNIGYKKYAFAEFDGGQYDSKNQVTIDEQYPTDKIVYVVYEYKLYTIKVEGLDSIWLNNGVNNVYPVNQISLSIVDSNSREIKTIQRPGNAPVNSITFDWHYRIGHTFQVRTVMNNGFTFGGYSVGPLTSTSNQIFFNIEDVVTSAATDEVVITITERYSSYELEYGIDLANAGNSVYDFMADIMLDIIASNGGTTTVGLNTFDSLGDPITPNENGEQIGTITVTNGTTREFAVTIGRTDSRHYIKVGNIHLYEQIKLISKGLEVQDKPGSYYQFNRFTEGGAVTLSVTPEAGDYYSHTEKVERNIIIDVIYSSPSTILIIGVNNTNAFDVQRSLILETADGTATLEVDENNRLVTELSVNGTIRVRFNTSSINFGYKFDHFLFEVGGTTQTSTDVPSEFTLQDQEAHYLTLYFTEIEYRIVVRQMGGGLEDDTLVDFDESAAVQNYLPVTVANLNVVFTMPNGYYVENLGFVKGASVMYLPSNQSNDYNSNIFDYNISLTDLASAKDAYGYAVAGDGYTYLDLRVYYTIHLYTFTIKYGIANAKGGDLDVNIVYPTIDVVATSNLTGETITADKEVADDMLTFANIPYGTRVEAYLTTGVEAGFKLFGWTDSSFVKLKITASGDVDAADVVVELETLTIKNLDTNAVYGYQISYIEYTIQIVKDGIDEDVDLDVVGNPTVTVAGRNTNIVKQNDSLIISANASKTYGYTHYSIKYEGFKALTADEAYALLGNLKKLYYIKDGKYVHPTGSLDYDSNISYYTYEERECFVGSYVDEQFDVLNYHLYDAVTPTETIIVTIVYDYLKINLSSSSALIGEYSLVAGTNASATDTGAINIPVSEFVKYSSVSILNYFGEIKEYDKTASATDIDKTSILNYRDRVLIYLKLNIAENIDGRNYELKDGVTLDYVAIMNNNYTIDPTLLANNPDYDYLIEFNVGQYLSLLGEDDTIYLTYNFKVETKTVTLKTNVEDPTFFNNSGQLVQLSIETSYGFGSTNMQLSAGQTSVSLTLQYLAKVRLAYDLNANEEPANHLSKYFRVRTFKVYDADGNLIADYSSVGVVPADYTVQRNISYIKCRYVQDIVVELTIQPVIDFHSNDSAKVFVEGENVTFETDYKCELAGGSIIAIAQDELTKGQGDTNNFDLQSTLANLLQIKYYLNGAEQDTVPTNVNTYTVGLSFNESPSWAWLKDIAIEYNITYIIKPLNIELRIDQTKVDTERDEGLDYFSRPYDGTSELPGNLVLQDYLIIAIIKPAGQGEIIVPATERNIQLSSGYNGRLTFTGTDGLSQIDAISVSSEERNIELTNLTLQNSELSRNFALSTYGLIKKVFYIKQRSVTISNLVVKDKIYDGERYVQVKNPDAYKLNGIIEADKDRISLNYERLNLRFEDAEPGEDKTIQFNVAGVLSGSYTGDTIVDNYILTSIGNLKASIYPDKLSTEVEGIGKVTVVNKRAIYDDNKVNLIPCHADLVVDVIKVDTAEYNRLYKNLTQYLTNNSAFSYGLRLRFKDKNNSNIIFNISNELYLEVPNVSKIKDSVWINTEGESKSGKVTHTQEGDKTVIDLANSPAVDIIVITEQRTMFQWWQVLIIVGGIAVVLVGVLVGYLVKRHKQLAKYKRHDKI